MHHLASRGGELTSARAVLRGTRLKTYWPISQSVLQSFQLSHDFASNKVKTLADGIVPPLQNIALYEWLPAYLGGKKLPPYPGESGAPGARVHVV